jgi:hypothetical protein
MVAKGGKGWQRVGGEDWGWVQAWRGAGDLRGVGGRGDGGGCTAHAAEERHGRHGTARRRDEPDPASPGRYAHRCTDAEERVHACAVRVRESNVRGNRYNMKSARAHVHSAQSARMHIQDRIMKRI